MLNSTSSSPATLVLYKSKYGSTKQYAEWIGKELHAEVYSIDDVRKDMLEKSGIVILGGSVRMGKITCAKFLKQHWDLLKDKKIILFSVSAARPDSPDVQSNFEKSIPSDMRASIKFVPLWGRFGALDWKDRLLMSFPRRLLRNQLRRDPGNEELRKKYEGMMKPFDHVERSAIEPVLHYARST